MLYLLANFFRHKEDVDKLADYYFKNADKLIELKNRFPDWEDYVHHYLSAETRAKLRERGLPL